MSIKPLPGQMLQDGFSRKERARRRWPRKVVGHSGFYEKLGFLFQGIRAALQTRKQFSQHSQGEENITELEFAEWVTK